MAQRTVTAKVIGDCTDEAKYVYRGSTDQWAVRHCLTHVAVRLSVGFLPRFVLDHGFVGPRIFRICQLECTPSGANLCDYSSGRYLNVEQLFRFADINMVSLVSSLWFFFFSLCG